MLDLVSHGRVRVRLGRDLSGAELGGFGVDRETKREQWDEAVDVITRMFVEEPFAGWTGSSADAARNVVPKPSRSRTRRCGSPARGATRSSAPPEKGIGALTFSFVEPEDAREWVDEYYAIIESAGVRPAGFASTRTSRRAADDVPRRRGDRDRARHRRRALLRLLARPLLRASATTIRGARTSGRSSSATRDERGFARDITGPSGAARREDLQEGFGSLRGAIGTPEQVRDLCRRYEGRGSTR
jgi:alkanesulfonate monooxygenase SsuD/methylene tetrahydromethanopterin reductase-like flavin-dependent oxidoreductase (luciferase family)